MRKLQRPFVVTPRSRYKEMVKNLLRAASPTSQPACMVASFGRAGSTLVYDALVEGMAVKRFGKPSPLATRLIRDEAWDLANFRFRSGQVYKTHDYPEALSDKQNPKIVFMFGSALDAAMSVYQQRELRGEEWVKLHFQHLKSSHSVDDVIRFDALGLLRQAKSWVGFEGLPVLCIRYEALWDNEAQLSEFCGFDIKLPARQERAAKNYDHVTLRAAEAIYGPIDDKLAKLPDSFVSQAAMARLLD